MQTDWDMIVERLRKAVDSNLPDAFVSDMTTEYQAHKAERLYWHMRSLAKAERMAEQDAFHCRNIRTDR